MERSSGTRQYRRLNRGGDRQVNAALHRIVQTRLRFDPRTQDYYERRTKGYAGQGAVASPGGAVGTGPLPVTVAPDRHQLRYSSRGTRQNGVCGPLAAAGCDTFAPRAAVGSADQLSAARCLE
ncbi:transposase [Streptomyces decoyicus]|uniref:transposase n=1 Tax=Streptomyces decoyicus TaxID=249567 RepID=UPI00386E07C2